MDLEKRIKFLEEEAKVIRFQRDKYIREANEQQDQHRQELTILRKRIDFLQENNSPVVDDYEGISSTLYDLEACINCLGPLKEGEKRTYGDGSNSLLSRLTYIRDMLVANYNYYKRAAKR